MNVTQSEEEILRALTNSYRSIGYEVYINPPPDLLPASFRELKPDAIALGKGKNVLIQVKRSGRTSEKISQSYTQISREHPEWELRVLYSSSSTAQEQLLTAPTLEQLRSAFSNFSTLRNSEFFNPAFIASWAVLEAAGRALIPERLAHPQPVASLLEALRARESSRLQSTTPFVH